MKNIMILITLLVSFHVFAGNGGGTMGMVKEASSSRIVYSYGEQDGFQKFVIGELINNEWRLTKIMTSTEQFPDEAVFNAILESDSTRNWVEVK